MLSKLRSGRHKLGVEHEEVAAVVRGMDAELARLWAGLRAAGTESVALVVTADHGHVTVRREAMVPLPADVQVRYIFSPGEVYL